MQKIYTGLPFKEESAQEEVPACLFIEMKANENSDKLLSWVGISLRGHNGRRPSPRQMIEPEPKH